MTLTHYAQLKAYWFNPRKTKVSLRIRDTQDFGRFETAARNILFDKLEKARANLAFTS